VRKFERVRCTWIDNESGAEWVGEAGMQNFALQTSRKEEPGGGDQHIENMDKAGSGVAQDTRSICTPASRSISVQHHFSGLDKFIN
jgi:hypothetical protein